MSTRTEMLNTLRQRLGVRADDKTRQQTVDSRLSQHRRNTLPSRADLDQERLVDLFELYLTQAHGSVGRVDQLEDVPDHLSSYLIREAVGSSLEEAEGSLSQKAEGSLLKKADGSRSPIPVVLSPEVASLALDFQSQTLLDIVSWQSKTSMAVNVSKCMCAVAETGTLVITSSANNALSQNFLCQTHVIVLMAHDLFPHYEDVWDRVRGQDETSQTLPRDITFVSGPSCTGDIEMIMEYGAHGPRKLHVIIVGHKVCYE